MSDFDGTADDRPTPPDELETSVATVLEELARRDTEQLAAVAAYAEELDAWVEADEGPADSSEAGDPAAPDADGYPDGVPERATVTVTEIGGTEYRYYQWREGDEIRSKTVEL